jgi:hypothetical protein
MRMISLSNKINNSHIKKMDTPQREHNSARHSCNAGNQFAETADRFPEPQHQYHVAKVK